MVSQCQGNFHSKTPSCGKIKSVFRNVKWCFDASWGLKGLMNKSIFSFISLNRNGNINPVPVMFESGGAEFLISTFIVHKTYVLVILSVWKVHMDYNLTWKVKPDFAYWHVYSRDTCPVVMDLVPSGPSHIWIPGINHACSCKDHGLSLVIKLLSLSK